MAYLGRKGASAPLTSADIPAGSVSAVKVASDVATQAELDAQRTNSSITTLGTVTAGNLSNTAIVYPAGHTINHSIAYMPSTQSYANSTAFNTFWSATYDPIGGPNNTSTIWAYLHLNMWLSFSDTSAGSDNRKHFDYLISGSDITNHQSRENTTTFGSYNWSGHSTGVLNTGMVALAPVTLDGTGNAVITYALDIRNAIAHAACATEIRGGGGTDALYTHIQFIEVI